MSAVPRRGARPASGRGENGPKCRMQTASGLQRPNGVVISVQGLSVEYPGGLRALENITLELFRGELTILLGRSGAGKSTLLRCLNLLQPPTAGTIRVEGFGDITRRNRLRDYRRQAGMVFQLHHLISRQSALQDVLMGRLAYHSTLRSVLPLPAADVALAVECLERVGLADKALIRVDRLSGGSVNAWASHGLWPSAPASSLQMSRSPAWIRPRRSRSWSFFAGSPVKTI